MVRASVGRPSPAQTVVLPYARITAPAMRLVIMVLVLPHFHSITAPATKIRGLGEMTARFYTVLMTVRAMEYVARMESVFVIKTFTA